MDLISSSPPLFAAVCGIVGLMMGSFLNVVISRLPKMMENSWKDQCAELEGREAEKRPEFNLVIPRSRCDSCGHHISPSDNIPVLSYLLLKGKCRYCKAAIPSRTAFIEALSGVLSAYAAWHFGFGMASFGALILVWAMIPLVFIDMDKQLLPDSITYPLLWTGLLFNLYGGFVSLEAAVLGAIFGYLSLWTVYWLFKIIMKKEGMGYGDFKLFAALGAWFGALALLPIILLSAVAGAAIGIALQFSGLAERGKPIPFGPFLATAGLIMLLLGPQRLIAWVLPGGA